MAGAKINVDFNDSQVQTALNRLLDVTGNTGPVMMEISEYLHQGTRERFDNEQGPDGNPWQPLKEATKKRKAKQGVPVDKILHGQTLHLRDTIFPFHSENEAGVSTGPGVNAYAASQQFGDDDRNIPARPFLGLSESDEQEILDILEDEILAFADGS